MSTETGLAASAAQILEHADNGDFDRFFSHFAPDCRFAWANTDPVEGLEAIQAVVGRTLADVSSLRHEIIDRWEGPDSAVLRMEVTYNMSSGDTLTLPAVTFMRFRDEQLSEYMIYQDPTPLTRAAS